MTGHLNWYAGRSVMVTGGMGFIGSHLAERLVGLGAQVTIVDAMIPDQGGNEFNVSDFADRVRLAIADIGDKTAMPALLEGQECIFNLAGQVSHIESLADPERDLSLNVRAQLRFMETLRTAGSSARLVYASTRQVYGRPDYLPVDERHPVRPTDVNGIHKYASEQYHLLYGALYGHAVVVLRLTNTYGPRQLVRHGRQGFIPAFIRTALEGGTIRLFGGGSQVRDANYVSDVVDALLRAGARAEDVAGQTFNLGAQPSFTLREFAEKLIDLVGRGEVTKAEWPLDRAKIDIGSFESDHSRITAELGWEATCALEAGLADTLAFYLEHGAKYW